MNGSDFRQQISSFWLTERLRSYYLALPSAVGPDVPSVGAKQWSVEGHNLVVSRKSSVDGPPILAQANLLIGPPEARLFGPRRSDAYESRTDVTSSLPVLRVEIPLSLQSLVLPLPKDGWKGAALETDMEARFIAVSDIPKELHPSGLSVAFDMALLEPANVLAIVDTIAGILGDNPAIEGIRAVLSSFHVVFVSCGPWDGGTEQMFGESFDLAEPYSAGLRSFLQETVGLSGAVLDTALATALHDLSQLGERATQYFRESFLWPGILTGMPSILPAEIVSLNLRLAPLSMPVPFSPGLQDDTQEGPAAALVAGLASQLPISSTEVGVEQGLSVQEAFSSAAIAPGFTFVERDMRVIHTQDRQGMPCDLLQIEYTTALQFLLRSGAQIGLGQTVGEANLIEVPDVEESQTQILVRGPDPTCHVGVAIRTERLLATAQIAAVSLITALLEPGQDSPGLEGFETFPQAGQAPDVSWFDASDADASMPLARLLVDRRVWSDSGTYVSIPLVDDPGWSTKIWLDSIGAYCRNGEPTISFKFFAKRTDDIFPNLEGGFTLRLSLRLDLSDDGSPILRVVIPQSSGLALQVALAAFGGVPSSLLNFIVPLLESSLDPAQVVLFDLLSAQDGPVASPTDLRDVVLASMPYIGGPSQIFPLYQRLVDESAGDASVALATTWPTMFEPDSHEVDLVPPIEVPLHGPGTLRVSLFDAWVFRCVSFGNLKGWVCNPMAGGRPVLSVGTGALALRNRWVSAALDEYSHLADADWATVGFIFEIPGGASARVRVAHGETNGTVLIWRLLSATEPEEIASSDLDIDYYKYWAAKHAYTNVPGDISSLIGREVAVVFPRSKPEGKLTGWKWNVNGLDLVGSPGEFHDSAETGLLWKLDPVGHSQMLTLLPNQEGVDVDVQIIAQVNAVADVDPTESEEVQIDAVYSDTLFLSLKGTKSLELPSVEDVVAGKKLELPWEPVMAEALNAARKAGKARRQKPRAPWRKVGGEPNTFAFGSELERSIYKERRSAVTSHLVREAIKANTGLDSLTVSLRKIVDEAIAAALSVSTTHNAPVPEHGRQELWPDAVRTGSETWHTTDRVPEHLVTGPSRLPIEAIDTQAP